MERFQKIRNNRRKFDISSICRFCGLENDERYNILQLNEDGVDFVSKVSNMIGIKVHGTDRMPQNVCFICMDKINDFYEFRLMALNTEKQTRDALGLPTVEPEEEKPKPKPPVKEVVQTKPAIVRLIDLKHSTKDTFLIQKALQKLNRRYEEDDDDIPSTSSFKRETTPAAAQPPNKKSRKDISCSICSDSYFSYMNDLQDHLVKEHLPLIAKYACGSCRETFEQLSDFKSHELMHAQKKLPFICYICKSKFTKLKDFEKHMRNFTCPRKKRFPVSVQDIRCFQCKKKFLTQNLFEWHGCFLKTRGTCTKCGLFVRNKKNLLKHYVLCNHKFVIPEVARDPNIDKSIKSEEISPKRSSIVNISNTSQAKSKGVRKKTVPQRRTTVFKAEREVQISLSSTAVTQHLQEQQQPEEEDDEYANYEEDITYDNFGSDAEEGEQTITNLEPVVQLQEPQGPRIIDIKAERSSDFEPVQEHTIESNARPAIDTQMIMNIKREEASRQAIVSSSPSKQKHVPENVRIKPEKSANEQSVVQVLNPMALSQSKPAVSMTARKKLFKVPQELASKIKKEKFHGDYGDNMDVVRDEAPADPEEEAQMENTSTLIKEEKLDSDQNAITVTSNAPKPNKQFINPIALAMMRKKNANKPAETTSNGSGLLIISAVTSMSEPNGDRQTEQMSETTDSAEKPTNEEINNENTQDDKLEEISNKLSEKNESNHAMIEIPAEFSNPSQNQNDIPVSEEVNQSVEETKVSQDKENIEAVVTTENEKETESQAIAGNEADELDQLLQKYGGDIDDTNELQDTDLQDLLKFD